MTQHHITPGIYPLNTFIAVYIPTNWYMHPLYMYIHHIHTSTHIYTPLNTSKHPIYTLYTPYVGPGRNDHYEADGGAAATARLFKKVLQLEREIHKKDPGVLLQVRLRLMGGRAGRYAVFIKYEWQHTHYCGSLIDISNHRVPTTTAYSQAPPIHTAYSRTHALTMCDSYRCTFEL